MFCYPSSTTLTSYTKLNIQPVKKNLTDYSVLGFAVRVADTLTTFHWLKMKEASPWPVALCGNSILSKVPVFTPYSHS